LLTALTERPPPLPGAAWHASVLTPMRPVSSRMDDAPQGAAMVKLVTLGIAARTTLKQTSARDEAATDGWSTCLLELVTGSRD